MFENPNGKPYDDKHKVRVSGRFTVESLSPHRSLAFDSTVDADELETISEAVAATEPAAPAFEQTILDNLAKAGIQNGRRHERIEFASVDSYPDRPVL